MRILLVEDETALLDSLSQILKKNNYMVDTAADGPTGLDCALSGIYDIIILDIMLPGMDGLSVLKKLRTACIKSPVLLLTARGDIGDRVTGLDLGADDYLPKPFASEELLARLRALSRRPAELFADNVINFGDLDLDIARMELRKSVQAVRLTQKEFELMRLLMGNPGAVLPKELLITRVWSIDSDAEYNQLEVYISFLRKKLGGLGSQCSIVAVRGAGYRLEVSA
ncbi:MAG: response regulator transcription factor [Bacillota bacterium]